MTHKFKENVIKIFFSVELNEILSYNWKLPRLSELISYLISLRKSHLGSEASNLNGLLRLWPNNF